MTPEARPASLPTLCAWCRSWIDPPGPGDPGDTVSHGICPDCRDELERKYGLRPASQLKGTS